MFRRVASRDQSSLGVLFCRGGHIVRFVVALLSLTLLSGAEIAGQTANMTPDALVQRGVASYRAGEYANAATDLDAAAKALLSQEQMQNYVNTGKFPNLVRFETALVYLTLAQSKLGHKDQAREAVLRLQTAERIDASYAQLSLGSDGAEFESTAAKLVPGFALKANPEVAHAAPPPQPAASTVSEAAPTTPAISTTTTASSAPRAAQVAQTSTQPAPPKPAPAPKQVAQTSPPPPSAPTQTATPVLTTEKLVVEPTLVSERADCQRTIDELVDRERAKIQMDADERIAAIQRAADERFAQAQKAAEAQIAAIQAQDRRSYLLSLRQADAMAATGKTDQANDIYNTIVTSSAVPREIVAEAAVGLYRTGAFRNAVNAFRKLVPYARGEEDLRYYNAVSLYEAGEYDDAKKELACALPYIQVTADVTRYREKIERTASRQALR